MGGTWFVWEKALVLLIYHQADLAERLPESAPDVRLRPESSSEPRRRSVVRRRFANHREAMRAGSR